MKMTKFNFGAFLGASLMFLASAHASVPKPNKLNSLRSKDLDTATSLFSSTVQKNRSVSAWIGALHSKFGPKTSDILHEILESNSSSESMRWASLIGVARLNGKKSLETLRTYMSHSSWLLRDAAIKSAVALNARELAPHIESRLQDEALVIRTSAVDAIGQLKLKTSSKKLLAALFDPSNTHGGKALWIHQHILKVLREFRYEAALPKLGEYAKKYPKDIKLRTEVQKTIRALQAKAPNIKRPDPKRL